MGKRKPNKPNLGSTDAERIWELACETAKETQKYPYAVAPKCSVPTENGPTLHEGDEVVPDEIEGGLVQVDRWVTDRYILKVDERVARSNRGEFEYKTLKSVVDGARHFDKGEGFNADEITVPATGPYQAVENGRVVTRTGKPEQPGEERVEQWIKRGLAERARLRDKVIASAKKALKREAKAESGK